MAGYNWNKGMSNNAIEAYWEGKKPIGKWANYFKKYFPNLDGAILKEGLELSSSEFHHTGKYYNETEFYEKDTILSVLGFLEYRRKIRSLIKEKLKKKKEPRIYTGCVVRWLEWVGKYPKSHPEEYEAVNCVVIEISSQFYEVILPSGRIFKKKKDTNGFYIYDYRGKWVNNHW